LTITRCKEEEEGRRVKRKKWSVQDKVTAASSKWGKDTTFSASNCKNATTLFLKSIEDEIGRTEMAKIMQKAMHIRSTGSQTKEEDVVTFETIDDMPEGMVIRNSDGQPESSSEDDRAAA